MRSFKGIFWNDKPGNVSVCSAIITIILCHMLRLEQFSFLHYCYSVVYSGIAICLIDKQMMRCLEMDRKIATTKPKIPPPFCAESKKSWTYNDLLSCHAKGYGTTNSERDGIACLSSRTIRLQKNSRTEELENSFDISAIVLAWDLKISKECHSWFQKKISNLMRRRNFRRLWLKSYPAKKRLIVPKLTGFKIFFRGRKLYF